MGTCSSPLGSRWSFDCSTNRMAAALDEISLEPEISEMRLRIGSEIYNFGAKLYTDVTENFRHHFVSIHTEGLGCEFKIRENDVLMQIGSKKINNIDHITVNELFINSYEEKLCLLIIRPVYCQGTLLGYSEIEIMMKMILIPRGVQDVCRKVVAELNMRLFQPEVNSIRFKAQLPIFIQDHFYQNLYVTCRQQQSFYIAPQVNANDNSFIFSQCVFVGIDNIGKNLYICVFKLFNNSRLYMNAKNVHTINVIRKEDDITERTKVDSRFFIVRKKENFTTFESVVYPGYYIASERSKNLRLQWVKDMTSNSEIQFNLINNNS